MGHLWQLLSGSRSSIVMLFPSVPQLPQVPKTHFYWTACQQPGTFQCHIQKRVRAEDINGLVCHRYPKWMTRPFPMRNYESKLTWPLRVTSVKDWKPMSELYSFSRACVNVELKLVKYFWISRDREVNWKTLTTILGEGEKSESAWFLSTTFLFCFLSLSLNNLSKYLILLLRSFFPGT